jgi:peptide/nickel transport system permease protein
VSASLSTAASAVPPPEVVIAQLGWWRILLRNKAAMAGLGLGIAIVLLALLGPVIASFDPINVNAGPARVAPNAINYFGTDELGRDVFARVVAGLRLTLLVGFSAALATMVAGILIGGIAGFHGGIVDDLLMRLTEVFQIVPRFFLTILLVALFGSQVSVVVIAIAALAWPQSARLVRAEFLSIKSRQFIDAARVAGASNSWLIFAEILPNAAGVVIAKTALLVGEAMLLEASLSYLGLGDPAAISLGKLLQESQHIMRQAWWAMTFPGLGIFIAVLAANLFGDGLDDVFNPRSQER